MKRSLALAAVMSLVGACSDPLVITCDPARHGAECLQGGISGECVATCDDSAHYCAFPAPHDCPETGLSYGALSGNHSETCVETCALAADAGVPDAPADSDAALACAPKIAFVSGRDGDSFSNDIYSMNLDGTDQRRVTVDSSPRALPRWSPDGRTLLFTCSFDVCTVPATGGANSFLTDAFDDTTDMAPAWSPDGSQITYTHGSSGAKFIMKMNADGSGKTPLTSSGHDSGSTYSPDGTRIAFSSNRDGNLEIYVMKVDGSQQTNLTNDPANDAADVSLTAAWSPDGTKLLFVSDRNANLDFDIYVVPAAGGPATPLSAREGNDLSPSWSPDGTRITWARDEGIYVMNSDGSGQIQVTHDANDGAPAWTQDGRIVFQRYVGQSVGGNDIFIVDAKAGAQAERLTSDLASDVNPAVARCPSP
jgi:Tol biopolymer transport system component